jgi:predicted DNA-binding transcriptional regulator AlpA
MAANASDNLAARQRDPSDRLIDADTLEQMGVFTRGTTYSKFCKKELPFPAVKVGRSLKFWLSDVHSYLASQTVQPKS